MARTISIFRYIAENNPSGAASLLQLYHAPSSISQSRSTKVLGDALQRLSRTQSGNANFPEQLKEIHPDNPLFVPTVDPKKQSEFKSFDDFDADYKYIDDVINQKLQTQNHGMSTTNILIGAGVGIALTIALVGLVKMIQK